MRISFIGVNTCIPDLGHESPCFLIDGKHIVDTGWCSALKMREYGFDPLELQSILFTHLHQDHYIGLIGLLFFVGLRQHTSSDRAPLNIVGPAPYLEGVVKSASEFLQITRFPELEVNCRLLPLEAGESFQLNDLRFETCAANHVSGHDRPEPALVYKVTDAQEGSSFAFTGDTHHHPPIAEFAREVGLLIHDGAHTAGKDAAAIAKAARAGRLLLIHYTQGQPEGLLAEARSVFPKTDLAEAGTTVEVRSLRPEP